MGAGSQSQTMADFSNSLPDPLEAARRRYGFASPDDLDALHRVVALVAREAGGCSLSLGDQGGLWFEAVQGEVVEPALERDLHLEAVGIKGVLKVPPGVSPAMLEDVSVLILEVLKLRRLGAERRRQPRGPEGASFVPGVVHELRNFLFAMGAGLDAFAARFSGEGEEALHAEALRRNLVRLQGFLEELHEYGNPGNLAFARVPVQPALAQSVRLAEPLALARDVRVVYEPLERAPWERMDRSALEASLRRLIELAALETQSGGEVCVTAQVVEGPGRPWVEVTILGTPSRGRALDPERLFEPF